MQMQDTTKQIQKYDLTSFLEKLQQLVDITAQRKVIASCNKYKYKNTKIQMQMQDTTKTNTKYDLTSFLKKLQLLIDITAQRNVIASCNKTNGCTQEKFYKWYFENIKSFAVMCQF